MVQNRHAETRRKALGRDKGGLPFTKRLRDNQVKKETEHDVLRRSGGKFPGAKELRVLYLIPVLSPSRPFVGRYRFVQMVSAIMGRNLTVRKCCLP